ncbi:hypothetical protein K3N28_03270 [Glycomyces sp. TRM65418]|uniref:hypothetical protein n=1 Tax=Glycomyces sp. TRM65418 TaxID=2867006 RepID=UPI001CE6D53B|nr:hypothetical protein [Glycomyces sp. TRM65418]MCC3762091.1 hypothetical protein [Glycomyces sp. TRM65418]QZD56158.1 hypothetical protein K3N28_03250 [Glycomyces sp. TRM65418]
MLTPPSVPPPPDLLLRKPGTVVCAQVMLWLQFSFLICCGAGGGLTALFWSQALGFDDFGFTRDFSEGVEDLAAVVVVVIGATMALVILFGVLAVKIGAGRRWAQVVTIAVMLLAFVVGFLGLYTGFQASEQVGEPVDGSRLIGTLVGLAMPLVTMLCLFTGSANQWFRQRGRDPLRAPQPMPFQPYR